MNMTMEERQNAMVQAAKMADPSNQQLPTLAQIAAIHDTALSIWQSLDRPDSDRPAYMEVEQLRKYFGYSKERIYSYLRWLKAHGVNIRMIQPTDEKGKLGHVRYNVADIEKAMLVVSDEEYKH